MSQSLLLLTPSIIISSQCVVLRGRQKDKEGEEGKKDGKLVVLSSLKAHYFLQIPMFFLYNILGQ
jgi:hypothetical protein